ncbi:TlpA disulfide reductase family protein, partial [Acinetobacter schindleri]
MMISSDALHLGPLMLPWALIIVATGLMLLSAILFG